MRYVVVAVALVACGDNRKAPPEASIPAREAAEPGLPYIEVPAIPDSNQASEVAVAASGRNVVVVAIAQEYQSADSFVPPDNQDDPTHPFRRPIFVTSHDGGYAFDPPQLLDPGGHTDPMVAVSADGSFWASAMLTGVTVGSDLYHSTDGGTTFQHVANVLIADKPWIVVDDMRRAIWMAEAAQHFLVGFDGTVQAQSTGGQQMASGYERERLPGLRLGRRRHVSARGAAPSDRRRVRADHDRIDLDGLTSDGPQWSVRAMRDGMLDGPIVVRVRHLPDEGSDLTISPPGTIGFLPTGALDTRGRLHVAWYDSSGATGQLFYAHSLNADLQGAWSEPVLVDGNACPGNGWYPSEKFTPEGERRLREYIGIATTGGRSIIAWTHAPEAPSRVRIAYIDD